MIAMPMHPLSSLNSESKPACCVMKPAKPRLTSIRPPGLRSLNNGRLPSKSSGYSLIELLIVVVVGGVLMTGAIYMMIAHMTTSSRSEAINRLQDSWSRIQFLMDQEIQEAIGTPTARSCSSLTLTVPAETGGQDTITYSLSGTDLSRTGPSVDASGRLTPGTSSTDLLMSNVTSFCPSINAGEVNYTMALRDPTGVIYQNQSQPSGARSRSRVID